MLRIMLVTLPQGAKSAVPPFYEPKSLKSDGSAGSRPAFAMDTAKTEPHASSKSAIYIVITCVLLYLARMF